MESKHDPIRKKEKKFDFVQVKKQNKTKNKGVVSLTLNVNSDTGLFPIGHSLVGCPTDDLLPSFNVGG